MTLYKEAFDYAMQEIRTEYKNKNEEDHFILWFNLQYVEDTIDTITISVKSQFLNMRMKQMGVFDTVQNKICKITGQNITLNVIIDETETPKEAKKAESKEEKVQIQEKDDKSSQKEEKSSSNSSKKGKHPLLQEEFTFDTFVPGENSDFAYKASLAVAKNPGKSYNPILLYGGSGLGKTHLMEAIGNYIWQNSTEKLKICYLSAETFINEFTSSISSKSPKAFKDKYRNLDVLLLDDIHFLSGKEATQEELFYTFNALHEKNAQMVFTCDRPIKEIKNMANRLVSRLSNGLCIDLQPPNYETRYAILQRKVEQKGINLSSEIIEYIAKNIETNVRELESALSNIIGYMDLTGQTPSIDDAKRLLKDLLSSNSVENISIDIIQKVIAENYQISVSDLKSKKRDKKFVIPRQIAIYIARTITEISYTELGIEFGGKDHSTIMHAYEKVEEQIKIDPSLNSKIEIFIREIKEYKK